MALTPQQEAEVAFWKSLVDQHGEYYLAYRAAEYYDKTCRFPSFLAQQGIGLDVGCGCISIFECSSKNLRAIDPLAVYYENLVLTRFPKMNVVMWAADIEVFDPYHWDSVQYNWAACLNMLDHTPNPAKALANIYKLLEQQGGRLYFEVNLEQGLAPPHYVIMTHGIVVSLITGAGFEITHEQLQNVPEHRQQRLWIEAVKR